MNGREVATEYDFCAFPGLFPNPISPPPAETLAFENVFEIAQDEDLASPPETLELFPSIIPML
jgi:hypothetical protein